MANLAPHALPPATGRCRRTLARGLAALLWVVVAVAAAPAFGAESHTTLAVSITVVNACSVSLGPVSSGGKAGVSSHCSYPQPTVLRAVPAQGEPGFAGQGLSQGVRYFAVEY
jgi:hypothetical protein